MVLKKYLSNSPVYTSLGKTMKGVNMNMKIFKNILLLVTCLMITACGGENLNAYKDKMLEATANRLGTTKELLVKDLDLVVDSMSLDYFLLEDSISLIKQIYDETIKEQEKQIEWRQKEIKKYEEANNRYYGKYTINKYKKDIEQLEKKIESIRQKHEEELAKFKGRNLSDVVYKVFYYRIMMKHPLKGIHEKQSSFCLFSPDGKVCTIEIDDEMGEYLKNREQLKQE